MRVSIFSVAASLLLGHAAVAAPPAGSGALLAVHSGRCLAGDDKPRAEPCDRADELTWVDAGGGRIMIRNERTGACLYSNHDGRFGWYACTPQYGDQYWSWGGGADDGLVRAVDSKQCLFSNGDGRFGLFACHPEYRDQHWRWVPRSDDVVGGGSIAGDWSWVDGARTAMRDDGSFVLPDDGAGQWRARGRGRFEVRWGDGRRDDVRLSPDGRTLLSLDGRVVARRGDGTGAYRTRPVAMMDAGSFEGLMATLRSTSSEIDKRDIVLSTVRPTRIDAEQLMQLLELFRSEVTKLQVVRGVAERVVDPPRLLAYGPRLRSSASRSELARIVAAVQQPAQPQPQPPSVPLQPSTPQQQPPSTPPSRPGQPRKEHVCKPMPACGIGCPGPMAHDENGCLLCACEPSAPSLR